MLKTVLFILIFSCVISVALCRFDVWNSVSCNEVYIPKNCNFTALDLVTVDDYDRCGPANLPLIYRNYFLGAAGRRLTYKWNKNAFDRIEIMPKLQRDASKSNIRTTVLGQEVDVPVGFAPVALLKLASPGGEIDVIKAMNSTRTIVILSSHATSSIEDVAATVTKDGYPHLWMHMDMFKDHDLAEDLVRRAERNNFKAIVLCVDNYFETINTCNTRKTLHLPPGVETPNIISRTEHDVDPFEYIRWLSTITELPIVAKGILEGSDATEAINAGASAILVSNHGGRQVDGATASIEALPGVVEAARKFSPPREVYLDGGVRSGEDLYKSIARGARMAFLGRPLIWGLAMEGSTGVRNVIEYLKRNFNETMLLSGVSNPSEIDEKSLRTSHCRK